MAGRARIKGELELNPPPIGGRKATHVSDIMASKGNQPAQLVGGFRRTLGGVSTSGDEHFIAPNLPQEIVRRQAVVVTVFVPSDATFGGVKVSEVGEPLFGMRDEVGESRFRVLHSHSLPGIPRGDPESDSIFANGVGDGFDDFQRESGTVLNRSTVFVGPLVGDVLEELVWEVSVGEVELDAVESGLVDGFVGSGSVPLRIGLDFFDRHRAWGLVGRGDGDGGWADEFEARVLGLEQLRVRGTTERPKLEEDV